MAVDDIDRAAERLRADFGLGTLAGRHVPIPGVLSAIVPLQPPQFVELISATDRSSDVGARVAEAAATGDRLFTWAIEPVNLDAVAARLGLDPRPGGAGPARWRIVGEVEHAHPFFIEFNLGRAERERGWRDAYRAAGHSSVPGAFTFLEVGGREPELRSWIGDVDLPIRFVKGEPGIRAAGIETAAGEVVVL